MNIMTQRRRTVKQKRAYDASGRQERARQTAALIVEVAERRFLKDGYGATITGIAAEAGVSADTIYKTFGGKAGLLRAIRTRALEGERAVPAEERSDELHLRESDPRKIIEAWGALTAEIAPRASPILLLVRSAAATDPDVRALQDEMDSDRHRRMTENAGRLRDAGHLRAGITVAQAADVLWTYSSPELYELLVLQRGWPSDRYGRFVAEAMIAALL
jgi:AcrR family transcriptional regulator